MNSSESDQATDPWGRVSEDGSVYVRTSDGERKVGQWPDGDPSEALAFFKKRYDDLAFEVDLLEQRVKAGALGPDEAAASVKQVRAAIAEAQAVGDLDGLNTRLDALTATIGERREQRKAERAKKVEEAKVRKEKIATEAERICESSDWRNGANRMRELLDEWKALPRLDKGTDDTLWRRFSTARTTYTRRRKSHFAELDREFAANAEKKEAILVEAEALLPVTDLKAAREAFRDLADRWDAAGKVPRDRMKELEGRIRKVEQAIRGVEDDQWRRSNPEARARAADTVSQLESSLAELQAKHDKAVAAGNSKKAEEHASAIEARRSWLTEAQKALDEFS